MPRCRWKRQNSRCPMTCSFANGTIATLSLMPYRHAKDRHCNQPRRKSCTCKAKCHFRQPKRGLINKRRRRNGPGISTVQTLRNRYSNESVRPPYPIHQHASTIEFSIQCVFSARWVPKLDGRTILLRRPCPAQRAKGIDAAADTQLVIRNSGSLIVSVV